MVLNEVFENRRPVAQMIGRGPDVGPHRLLHQKLFVEANPIPVKWAMAEMGLIERGLRLPLSPLAERFHDTVREALHEAGIALPGLRVVERRG